MADPPDLEDLAKQYMDLWQQQLTDMAADPALARTMAQTMELMNAGGGPFAAMMQSMTQGAGRGHNVDGAPKQQNPGAETAGAASGDLEQRVDELARRVAELEKRLDDVAASPSAQSKSAKRSPGKRRS